MSQQEETISYPSIAIVLALSYLLYRYFTSPATPSQPSSGLRFTPAQVDQVSGMFPQLSRRDIMWDLQRNRGSVQGTIERVLAGRSLDPAPPSFQPNVDPAPSTTTSTQTAPKKIEQDLIQRYGLQSRVDSETKGKGKEVEVQHEGWSSTKESRQETLKRRRDEMILEARRKMMEKDRLKAEQASTATQ